MTKTKIILLVSFVLTAAAGAAVGMLVSWPKPRRPHRPGLAEELGLSAEQQQKMRKIWSEVMGLPGRHRGEERRALAQERDEAIVALLTDEQLPGYKEIVREYERKLEELSQERRRRVEEAVERTKQILTPEQAVKYEELLKKRGEKGRGRGPGLRRRGSWRGRSDQRPTPRGEE